MKNLQEATKRDPLAYGITYIDLLENKRWKVDSRKWIKEIYNAVNPYWIEKNDNLPRKMVLMKPTQIGMSTMALTKMFHFVDNWSTRIMYTLPRQQDVLDMVGTRVDPMLANSAHLKSLVRKPDSTRVKAFGNSFIFFMELSVEPRMMPADALYIDEVDLSDMVNMGTALNRMDDSQWKLLYQFGTPTVPNYGIDGLYYQTDMRRWLVKCPSCNTWQNLDWEKNLRIVGIHSDPDDVFFGCKKCNHNLTLEIIQEGQWVPEVPKKSDEHLGYHISQMMTHDPMVLYKHFRDPMQSLQEFYRKRLGKPYTRGSGSLVEEDFLGNCFSEGNIFESYSAEKGARYYMGVDQGNELQVIVAKVPQDKTQPIIVHSEVVPFDKGFSRIGELMNLFKITKAVIDGDPNRHPVRDLQKEFPARVVMADYAKINVRFKASAQIKGKPKLITNVAIHRTEALDDIVDSVQGGWWRFPGMATNLDPRIATIIDQACSMRRDIEVKKNTQGSEDEVVIWRKLGPDHFMHCLVYLKTAVDLGKKKGMRGALIGGRDIEKAKKEKVDENALAFDEPGPPPEKEETKKPSRIIRIR